LWHEDAHIKNGSCWYFTLSYDLFCYFDKFWKHYYWCTSYSLTWILSHTGMSYIMDPTLSTFIDGWIFFPQGILPFCFLLSDNGHHHQHKSFTKVANKLVLYILTRSVVVSLALFLLVVFPKLVKVTKKVITKGKISAWTIFNMCIFMSWVSKYDKWKMTFL
jgi:hypothetical protein